MLAFSAAGFDAVEPLALESFRAEVEEYTLRMLSLVSRSMLSCRRTAPIPQDFAAVLARERLSLDELAPYLMPSIPPSSSQPRLELSPPTKEQDVQLAQLLGPELSGESERDRRRFVPAHFPPFPSKHTYQFTFTSTERRTDPRQVRELATADSRLGEDALRRLVSNSWTTQPRTGDAAGGVKRSRRDELQTMWLETMEKAAERDMGSTGLGGIKDGGRRGQNASGEQDQAHGYGVARLRLPGPVNYERQYWQKDPRTGNQRGDLGEPPQQPA
ncbi:MAG: hypothetical protein M1815_005150 [Lichina confinis]|nr:MAG: hypothetical protein M1815_005150 [Lichina confinis]